MTFNFKPTQDLSQVIGLTGDLFPGNLLPCLYKVSSHYVPTICHLNREYCFSVQVIINL